MKQITIYDHNTHPIWSKRYQTLHVAHNRTNGGYTYSCDIVKFHLPIIMDLLKKQEKYQNILISTVEFLSIEIIPHGTDLIICYLHQNIDRDMIKIKKWQQDFKGIDIIYIASRETVVSEIKKLGIKAIKVPMGIDTMEFEKYKLPDSERYNDKRVIYFGNTYFGKGNTLETLRSVFTARGWIFDIISSNAFNGKKITRDEIMKLLPKYRYGVAEARCYLEMNVMGIKTLLCAEANQGLITNDEEFEYQKAHNFSDGRVWTFSPDIETCIDNFDKAMLKSYDVREALPDLKKQLKALL